jgi:hypothetical protein
LNFSAIDLGSPMGAAREGGTPLFRLHPLLPLAHRGPHQLCEPEKLAKRNTQWSAEDMMPE